MEHNNRKPPNMDYDNELNVRIMDRYYPEQTLKPNYNPVPAMTKYVEPEDVEKFIYEDRNIANDGYMYRPYDTSKVYYPGTSHAPVDYKLEARQIQTESILRGQHFKLYKKDRLQYMPEDKMTNSSPLFGEPEPYCSTCLSHSQVNLSNNVNDIRYNNILAPELFHNSTRSNRKDIMLPYKPDMYQEVHM